jgi:hypothetical protein
MVSMQASSQHVPTQGLPAHITVGPTDMPPAPALVIGVTPPAPAPAPVPAPLAAGVRFRLPGVAACLTPCAQPMTASANNTVRLPLTALRLIQHLDWYTAGQYPLNGALDQSGRVS